MSKKIKVYTSGHDAPLDLSMKPLYKWPLAATLVVHDGDVHQQVYTQRDVDAILMQYAHLVEGRTGQWVSPSDVPSPSVEQDTESPAPSTDFKCGEKVIFRGKVYDFGYYGAFGNAIIYNEGEANMQDAYAVDRALLSRSPQ